LNKFLLLLLLLLLIIIIIHVQLLAEVVLVARLIKALWVKSRH
jgi:hypothetical protein